MKPIFLLWALLGSCIGLPAQNGPLDSVPRHFTVGLNITNTLGNFLGSGAALTSDPYLLNFRIGNARRRLRLGLNFKVRDKRDPDQSSIFSEKSTDFRARLGYEWTLPMSRRLSAYWGLDGVFEYNTDDIRTSFQSGGARLQTRQGGLGGGPVFGINWWVHPRVALSTECSLYAIGRRGRERVTAPPDFSDQPIRDFVWQPLLPTSLYLNFSF
ncbi:MAG: hypothetical protein ABIO24_09365 [Saprospiraceae bacterium]